MNNRQVAEMEELVHNELRRLYLRNYYRLMSYREFLVRFETILIGEKREENGNRY